jgi:hypothetical protein
MCAIHWDHFYIQKRGERGGSHQKNDPVPQEDVDSLVIQSDVPPRCNFHETSLIRECKRGFFGKCHKGGTVRSAVASRRTSPAMV